VIRDRVRSINILGVRIDDVDYDSALAEVENYLREDGCHQIATVNPEFVTLARRHLRFRNVLNSTALNVPDGVGIVWAAARSGHPLSERVTGQELVDRIAARATLGERRLFLLGAREGVAELAAAELQRRHPGLIIAGCHAGSPAPAQDQSIVARVNASGAGILFVAYGPPKQELWIARNAARLQVSVAMGVGGTFDTLAGIVPRAPRWMQAQGLEWAFRLVREPRRLRRQLALPYFVWLVLTNKKVHPSSNLDG
jgi:N-acetylglucosaminyldiphosphoundecaprenol N-acetyl-beta-D-mannosaminyltransferase